MGFWFELNGVVSLRPAGRRGVVLDFGIGGF
jgi:hypothetical protein